MKSPIFPLAFISLFTPTCFVALQSPRSGQAEFASTLQDAVHTQIPKSCPVTKPPTHAFVPPSPYPRQFSTDGFWFGTEKLWTALLNDGTWNHLPRADRRGFGQKLFWWRQGYDPYAERQPKLTVTGTRLDSSEPPVLFADHASNGWQKRDQAFMVVGIDIPALGCWKITGHYQDQELSFVVWVAQ